MWGGKVRLEVGRDEGMSCIERRKDGESEEGVFFSLFSCSDDRKSEG